MSTYKLIKARGIADSLNDYLGDLDSEHLENLLGGFTSDTKLCWVASESYLEVMMTKSAETVSRWTFGSALKLPNVKIVSVDELRSSLKEVVMLVVGLEYMDSGGMVCIFDVYAMKIVRAIEIPEKVKFVHVIYNGNEHTTFPGLLNSFDGAIAVGTAKGNVYIVDLCREAIYESRQITPMPHIKNEVDPCTLLILRPDDMHRIESHKELADRNGNHLAIHLNATWGEQSPHFVLKGPQGDNRLFVNREEAFVSSLHYAPQLTSLLVGYNFGALQIWNLISMDLVYTSPVYEENIPISHFSVQEPVDDPRAFCYFWAVYSYEEPYNSSFPVAALYSLCYDSMEWHEGYGCIYQNLLSCNIRFHTDLDATNKFTVKNAIGGKCLRLHSLSNGRNRDAGDSSGTESSEDSYKLCLMVWNVWCKDRSSHTFLSIFDLNQWYKEQMPNAPHSEQSKKYMSTVCISDVMYQHNKQRFPVIDVHVNPKSIWQFRGAQKLEEHYYPTSLCFESVAITKHEICSLKNFGVQRKFYYDLGEDGPLALLKPADLYERSIEIGLTPLFMDSTQVNLTNPTQQREHVLSIALEHKMSNWLYKCAASWGNGSHRAAGLSLDLILNWAWQRAKVLKINADRICTTMFDYSGIKLDQNERNTLGKCRGQILVLKNFYKYVCTNCRQFLINTDLTIKQYECLERIYTYLDVLGWMYNMGLLPERNSQYVDPGETSVPYRLDSLKQFYNERRLDLRRTDSTKKLFGGNSILFIDKFIEMSGCQGLEDEWKCVSGGESYPPASLQAILRTYVVKGLDLQSKHFIVSYLLMDIADSLDPVQHKLTIANLLKFPIIFQFSRSQLKLVQAFWHLDHNQLGSAAELFIDPMLEFKDLEPWHHKHIMFTFMLQEANKLALLYLTFKKPPINEINDVSLVIAVYVNNKMLHEAFSIQREHSGGDDTTLLNVIFKEILKTDQLNKLLTMTLSRKEEEELILFLDKVCYHDKNNFKALYFAMRGRYMDFNLHVKPESAKPSSTTVPLSSTVKDLFDSMMPRETKRIADLCLSERTNLLKHSTSPKPLSTFLFNKAENLKYKSSFLFACIAKAHETWSDSADRAERYKDKNVQISGEDFPFLRPPMAFPHKHSPTSQLIYAKVVTSFTEPETEEEAPSPVKKIRLSPQVPVLHTPHTPKNAVIESKLLTNFDTPVITNSNKRRTSPANVATPHSILKEHSTVREVSSRLDGSALLTPTCIKSSHDESTISSIGKRVILTPSKRRSMVRFTDIKSTSSSGTTTLNNTLDSMQLDISQLPGVTDTSVVHRSSLDVNETSTESFYSPEVSCDNDKTLETDAKNEADKKSYSDKDVSSRSEKFVEKREIRAGLSETYSSKSITVTNASIKKTPTSYTEKSSISSFKESSMKNVLDDSMTAVSSPSALRGRKTLIQTLLTKELDDSTLNKEDSPAMLGVSSSPVPGVPRSRRSYKDDTVKRQMRSSVLFKESTESERTFSEDTEEEEDKSDVPEKRQLRSGAVTKTHDESREASQDESEDPAETEESDDAKEPEIPKSMTLKEPKGLGLSAALDKSQVPSPYSRRSYRGADTTKTHVSVDVESLLKIETTQPKQLSEDEKEVMETISINSSTMDGQNPVDRLQDDESKLSASVHTVHDSEDEVVASNKREEAMSAEEESEGSINFDHEDTEDEAIALELSDRGVNISVSPEAPEHGSEEEENSVAASEASTGHKSEAFILIEDTIVAGPMETKAAEVDAIETISITSKSTSDGVQAVKSSPRSPARSKRVSLRSQILTPSCRRSLRSNSPKLESSAQSATPKSLSRRILDNESNRSMSSVGTLNEGFIQDDPISFGNSPTSEVSVQNVTPGNSSFASLTTEMDKSECVFEKNINEGDLSGTSEESATKENTKPEEEESVWDVSENVLNENIKPDEISSFEVKSATEHLEKTSAEINEANVETIVTTEEMVVHKTSISEGPVMKDSPNVQEVSMKEEDPDIHEVEMKESCVVQEEEALDKTNKPTDVYEEEAREHETSSVGVKEVEVMEISTEIKDDAKESKGIENVTENTKMETQGGLKEEGVDENLDKSTTTDLLEHREERKESSVKVLSERVYVSSYCQTDVLDYKTAIPKKGMKQNRAVSTDTPVCSDGVNSSRHCQTDALDYTPVTSEEGGIEKQVSESSGSTCKMEISDKPDASDVFSIISEPMPECSVILESVDVSKHCQTNIVDNTQRTPTKDKKISTDSPARRTRSVTSSGSSTPVPARSLRSRRSITTENPVELPKTPPRRRSSLSVKEEVTKTRRVSTSTEPGISMAPASKRKTRAKSVDTVLEPPAPKVTSRGRGKKAALPAIEEINQAVEEYSDNRRLTRRQKELFMKNMKGDDRKTEKYSINLQNIDPIQLLDKEEFKGKADPEEQKLLNSPAPSVISSSATEVEMNKRRHSSDQSDAASEVSSPRRILRSSSKPKDDACIGAVPTRRARRASKDSVASGRSSEPDEGHTKRPAMKHTLSHISEDSQEEPAKPKAKRGRARKN